MTENLRNFADFIEREVASEIETSVYGASKVLQLSERTELSLGGKKIPILNDVKAGMVTTKGGKKPVRELTTENLLIDPVEFAIIIPFHKDEIKLKGFEGRLAPLVATKAVDAIAEAIDTVVFTGEDANGTPAPANFGTFNTLNSEVLVNKSTLWRAISMTQAQGRIADSIILSTGLLLELLSAYNYVDDATFRIEGDMKSGTIEGLPYITFNSTQKIGYLGAFKTGSKYGMVGNLDVTPLDQATVGDINLAEQNMHAVRVSGDFGFNFFTEDNFITLTSYENSGS